MTITAKNRISLTILAISLFALAFLHLISGQIAVNLDDLFAAVFSFDPENIAQVVLRESRIPRMVMAILAGSGLSIAGMLMQTLFSNPLAGPYVLGINSGSSLLVALTMMSGISLFSTDLGIIFSALTGSFIFGFIILVFSFYTRSSVSLLLTGMMLGSFSGAIISVLQTFTTAQQLKSFTLWSMGSLQQVEFSQLPVILLFFALGILAVIFLSKPLNTLVLGERNAAHLGIQIKTVRMLIILVTALFSGLITAFCGPIAFVGLAVPNLSRALFQTQNHRLLLLGNTLIGALFILISDIIIQLLENSIQLPINAFTSLIGAPIVIFIILKKLK